MIKLNRLKYSWELFFMAIWTVIMAPLVFKLPNSLWPVSIIYWFIAYPRPHFWTKNWVKQIVRASLLVFCLAIVFLQLKGRPSLEDVMSFFIFLPILKNMELNDSRDRRIQILILTLLWASSMLFMDQLFWIPIGILVTIFFGTLMGLSQYSSVPYTWHMIRPVLKQTGLVTVAGLPLSAIFFILFPRMHFFGQLYWPEAKSGISALIRPGDVAKMALDDSPFANILWNPSENAATNPTKTTTTLFPPAIQYWRYATLRKSSNGLVWNKLLHSRRKNISSVHEKMKEDTDLQFYQVVFQQMGEGQLINLEGTSQLFPIGPMTISANQDGTYSGIYFQGRNPVYRSQWQQALSQNDLPTKEDLEIPEVNSDRFQSWTLEIKNSKDPARVLKNILTKDFTYTLSPGPYQSLEQFAFEGKQGYCEHFSAFSTTLFRLAGIPARVVVGFMLFQQGDDGATIIRNSDAHAWVEFWNKDIKQWMRFDPTTYVAPGRLQMNGRDWRQYTESGFTNLEQFLKQNRVFQFRWIRVIQETYLRTNLWVLNFDRDEQRKIWRFEGPSSKVIWPLLGFLATLFVVFMGWTMRAQQPKPSRLSLLWKKSLEHWFAGYPVELWRTPNQWMEIARRDFSNSEDFHQLMDEYLTLRFGREEEQKQSHVDNFQSKLKSFKMVKKVKRNKAPLD